MGNFPCPEKISCDCSDSPFANLTSENPDQEVFLGDNYGWSYYFPNLGSNWTRNSCLGICSSLVSQADADLCAALNNILCAVDDSGVCADGNCPPPGPPGVPGGPPTVPGTVYYNSIQSCTISCPDGLPFTYQVAAGLFASTYSQALVDQMAYSYACTLATQRLVCLSALTNDFCCANTFLLGYRIIASAPTACSFAIVSGSLPAGVTLFQDSIKSVRLDGTPTTPGNYGFTLRVVDTLGNYMQKTYTLKVLGFTTPAALPDGNENAAYSQPIAAEGGDAPLTYGVVSGALPGGMTLAGDGLLYGTPSESGDFTFTIRVTDS